MKMEKKKKKEEEDDDEMDWIENGNGFISAYVMDEI